jgi:hypothetical protein
LQQALYLSCPQFFPVSEARKKRDFRFKGGQGLSRLVDKAESAAEPAGEREEKVS